jgi:hypothetical protein
MQTAAAGHGRYMLVAVLQRLARQIATASQAVDARARARVRERAGNRCEYRHLHQGLNLRVLFLVDVAESILVTAGNAHPSSSNLPGIAGLRLARSPGEERIPDWRRLVGEIEGCAQLGPPPQPADFPSRLDHCLRTLRRARFPGERPPARSGGIGRRRAIRTAAQPRAEQRGGGSPPPSRAAIVVSSISTAGAFPGVSCLHHCRL